MHGQWPIERKRDRRGRSGKRTKRRRARDSVHLQARPFLEAAQSRFDVRSEDAVEPAGGEAVLGELELK